LRKAVGDAAAAHGPVTVLVNNAARDDRHEIEAVDEDYWENNLAINLRPQFFTIQAVVEGMKQAGGGAIVNFTSTSYMLNGGDMPAYTSAKAGVVGLTKGMAGKLGPHNIRVNAIAPGWVMTERQKNSGSPKQGWPRWSAGSASRNRSSPRTWSGPACFWHRKPRAWSRRRC
jgi:NAD(P)-dependent dehydrogenase (short-subunit alcohol dehydrogenase family)